MKISPARLAAYRVLRAVDEGRLDLPEAMARERALLPDARDRALATEIATGTLRWRGTLDYLIGFYSRRDPARLDPEILDVLRIGAYQVLHLDRVPAPVAVDEAVRIASSVARKRSAGSLVNAVLRAVARNRSTPPLPAAPPPDTVPSDPQSPILEQALDYLSITLSHPRWLVERWLNRYGFEAAEKWARFNNSPAPLTLRVNTLRIDRDALGELLARHDVITEPARYSPFGLVVVSGNPYRTPLAAQGLFIVQDEASQLVPLMAAVRPGERVLDACAAPGGKTAALAASIGDEGLLVAVDSRRLRVALLDETVKALGLRRARIVQADVTSPLPFRVSFDCALIDAPCSGLGTIRRDPEVRWRRTPEDLPRLAGEQAKMLERVAEAVEPGGRLVYATCSSEPEENEEVIARFLERRDDFQHEDPRKTDGIPEGLESVIDSAGNLRTYPHVHGLEAFFAARLRRSARR